MMLSALYRFLLGTLRGRLILSVAAVLAVIMPLCAGGLILRQRAMFLERQTEQAVAVLEALAVIARTGILYTAAAIGIGCVIAWVLGRWITQRLFAVQKTINQVRSGNSQARCSISGIDEAAMLAQEFNLMLDVLEERDADLRASEEKYSALIGSANDAVFMHEIHEDGMPGPFIEVNEVACSRLGYTKEEFARMTPLELDDPRYRRRITEATERLLREGRAVFETAHIAKDGRSIPVEVSTRLLELKGKRLLCSIVRDISERKCAEEALRESEVRLRALSTRLVEAQENERRHVAAELHDEIGQTLTGLKLMLGSVMRNSSGDLQAQLAEARQLVEKLMSQVRAMSLSLRPQMLDDLGLLPALLWHFDHYKAQTGVHVDFAHSGLNRRFSQGIETCAFRIIQEGLTNVARHACVGTVAVCICSEAGLLRLDIQDQGVGFNSQRVLAADTSNGLAGMRERAESLGGSLQIVSGRGQGVRLTATLPVDNDAQGTADYESNEDNRGG